MAGRLTPNKPPIRTSGTAISTVRKGFPENSENSSMNAPNSRKHANDADPMLYPWQFSPDRERDAGTNAKEEQ